MKDLIEKLQQDMEEQMKLIDELIEARDNAFYNRDVNSYNILSNKLSCKTIMVQHMKSALCELKNAMNYEEKAK